MAKCVQHYQERHQNEIDFVPRISLLTLNTYSKIFNCSESTIKILEKDVNMFKVNNKNTRTTSMFLSLTLKYISHVFVVLLLLTLNK